MPVCSSPVNKLYIYFHTDSQGSIPPCNVPMPCTASRSYGDPTSCQHYYQCGSGGFVIHRRACVTDELRFDTVTRGCVFQYNNYTCEPPCPSTPMYTGTGTPIESGKEILQHILNKKNKKHKLRVYILHFQNEGSKDQEVFIMREILVEVALKLILWTSRGFMFCVKKCWRLH